jgi:hypothetical protein
MEFGKHSRVRIARRGWGVFEKEPIALVAGDAGERRVR